MKYNTLTSIRKIWSPAANCEIKILEMESEGPFVKYTTLENNHLHGKGHLGDHFTLLIIYKHIISLLT